MVEKPDNHKQQFPEGYFITLWTGIGIALFSGLGIPLSIALDSFAFIGLGPAIGVSIGVAIGTGIENQKKQEGLIRPLTEKGKKTRKRVLGAAIGLLVLGALAFLFVLWMIN